MFFADFGSTTAVGFGTRMTMAAISAEVTGYREASFICQNQETAVMSLLDEGVFISLALESDYAGSISDRMIRCAKLIYLASNDLRARFPSENKYPLIWLDNEPGVNELLPKTWVKQILEEAEAPVDTQKMYWLYLGRAGGLIALEKANALMHTHNYDYVIIGAAESPSARNWLEFLDRRGRLKNGEAKDAFVPGEGAGFLLLARTPELAQAYPYQTPNGNESQLLPTVQFTSPGYAESPSHWYNTNEHRGEALHEAVQQAIYNTYNSDVFDTIVASLNGELFWMKEHRILLARRAKELIEAKLYHPFEFTGDLACLSGIFLLAYSAHLIINGKSKHSLVYASSDNQWRAASQASAC